MVNKKVESKPPYLKPLLIGKNSEAHSFDVHNKLFFVKFVDIYVGLGSNNRKIDNYGSGHFKIYLNI